MRIIALLLLIGCGETAEEKKQVALEKCRKVCDLVKERNTPHAGGVENWEKCLKACKLRHE